MNERIATQLVGRLAVNMNGWSNEAVVNATIDQMADLWSDDEAAVEGVSNVINRGRTRSSAVGCAQRRLPDCCPATRYGNASVAAVDWA